MSNLSKQLEKFAESLEDKPDPWFNKPKGWLRKPDFKRDAQLRSTLAKGSGRGLFDSFMPGNSYNRRFFVLDAEKRMLWYFQDDQSSEVKGEVDLKDIIAVDASHVHDAPSHSLDLISADRHYTVTAESQQEMLRWAYAISLLIARGGSGQSATEKAKALATHAPQRLATPAAATEDKWHRYDVVFDTEGPLYLNVMGSANKVRVWVRFWVRVRVCRQVTARVVYECIPTSNPFLTPPLPRNPPPLPSNPHPYL